MKGHVRLMKIKTTGLSRIGKVMLWTLVIFLILKGVASILNNRSEAELLRTIDDYRTAAEQRETVRAGAAAFAENFVYEYYSFDGRSNQDYPERVGKYLAASLSIPKPAGSGVSTSVLSARTTSISFADRTRMDVDVSAKIHYSGTDDETISGSAIAGEYKDLHIRVPVAWKEEKYAVDAIPLLIPEEDAAKADRAQGFSGIEVTSKEKGEISLMLESFLKTYYEGSGQEVSYYLSSDSEVKHGLNGAATFAGLRWVTAYYLDAENEYLASVSITIRDSGQEISQEMHMTLVKKGSKYYIRNISTRVPAAETENGGK